MYFIYIYINPSRDIMLSLRIVMSPTVNYTCSLFSGCKLIDKNVCLWHKLPNCCK